MVRNLIILKGYPFKPGLSCLKKTGGPILDLTSMAQNTMTGDNKK
jgi:hypothetical protein